MSNDFTHQYAIQLPNGELLMRSASSLGLPNISRMLGLGEDMRDAPQLPRVWDTSAAAQAELQSIQVDLARKGIEWLAVVVQRLCTPFTVIDPAEHFAGEVQSWLDQQGGAS